MYWVSNAYIQSLGALIHHLSEVCSGAANKCLTKVKPTGAKKRRWDEIGHLWGYTLFWHSSCGRCSMHRYQGESSSRRGSSLCMEHRTLAVCRNCESFSRFTQLKMIFGNFLEFQTLSISTPKFSPGPHCRRSWTSKFYKIRKDKIRYALFQVGLKQQTAELFTDKMIEKCEGYIQMKLRKCRW